MRNGGHMPTPIQSRTVVPQPDPDPFVAKFTAEPYFTNRVWFSGRWVAVPVAIPAKMAEWLLSEMGKRGTGLSTEDKRELVEIELKWRALEDRINENGFISAIGLFQKQRDAVRSELEMDPGKSILPNRVQSREELEKQSAAIRYECRRLQTKLSQQVYAIMNPFCERVRKLTRELVESQDKSERHSIRFDFGFKPSDTLKALIYLAVAGYAVPVSNYMPEWPTLRVDSDFFGAQLFDLPRDERAIEAARQKLAAEQDAINSGRERQRQRNEAARELSASEHKKAVEEISSKNDAIRAEIESNSLRVKNERAAAVSAGVLTALGKLIPASDRTESKVEPAKTESKTTKQEKENGNEN